MHAFSADFEDITRVEALPISRTRALFCLTRAATYAPLTLVGKKSVRWNQRRRGFSVKRYLAVLKGLQARCITSHRHPARCALLQHCAGNLKSKRAFRMVFG